MNNRPEKSELKKPAENARSLSTGGGVKFSPLLQSSFARLASQLARSSSNLEIQTIDEQQRIQRGSICSSTSNDCISAALLFQQQEVEKQRQRQQDRQKRKTSRAGNKTNQNSFSSRGSTASHIHSSASSSLVGGSNTQLVSQCRNCAQDYRCTCCPRCNHLILVYNSVCFWASLWALDSIHSPISPSTCH